MTVRTDLWAAINQYVEACGGDPSKNVYGASQRQRIVVRIEGAVDKEVSAAAVCSCGAPIACNHETHPPIKLNVRQFGALELLVRKSRPVGFLNRQVVSFLVRHGLARECGTWVVIMPRGRAACSDHAKAVGVKPC